MKKAIAMALACTLTLSVFTGCGSKEEPAPVSEEAVSSASSMVFGEAPEEPAYEYSDYENELLAGAYASGKHHVELKVKDLGTIKLELDGDTAPLSTANFCTLAAAGFYDGLTFHRIIDGFMIQGGDPMGNGLGGSENTIQGEFAVNGVENSISHLRGVISMARAQEPNSASSQFFIVHQDSEFLDSQYAAFGMVTEGMDIVDTLATSVPVQDDNGTVDPADQPVIESITVVD